LPELLTVQDALTRHRGLVLDAIREPRLEGLIWEATLACNLACAHCGNPVEGKEGDGPWRHGQELKTDEVKRIFSEVAADFPPGTISIGITGGEATLRKDLSEIVAHLRDLRFNVSLTTNGMLTGRDPALLDRLVESGVRLFTISIDGLKEGHDRQRGIDGSFDLAVSTIRQLRERHPKVQITVNTIATPLNWKDIPGVYALMQELKVPLWNLGPVSPVGRAKDPLTHLTNEQLRDLLEWITEKNKPANVEATGVRVAWVCDGWVGAAFEGRVRESMFFCGAGTRIASVLYDGKAATCLEVRREIGVQGDLRKERLKDVWERRYDWFRGDRSRFRKGPCVSCDQWDWCQGSSLHLREADGELIECIYHRQAQAKPRDGTGLPTVIDSVELAPLTIVERGGTFIVGNDDTGTFAEMPPIGVAVIRALQREPFVEKARAVVKAQQARDVDVAAFVRSIAAGGFVAKINGVALEGADLPKRRRKLFENVPPERLRFLKGPLFWWITLLPFAAALALMARDAWYRPLWSDFLVSPIYTIVGLSLFASMTILVAKHELGHVLMARALGGRASLGVSTRLAYLVVETDASNLWVLPRKDRMKVYAAGMATDMFVIGVLTLLLAAGREWGVGLFASDGFQTVARLFILGSLLIVLFQFFFQVRTDVYYMVAHGLECRNLYGDARQWLRRRFAWAWPRWRNVPEPNASAREMRWIRMYGVLHFVGVGVFFVYFFGFIVPTLLFVYGHAIDHLWKEVVAPGSQEPVVLVDSLSFFLIHGLYFGAVAWLAWRERRRDATGLATNAGGRAPVDAATARLLSHPAPDGMASTVGGRLYQMDPERARQRAVVLGPHLKAATLRASRER